MIRRQYILALMSKVLLREGGGDRRGEDSSGDVAPERRHGSTIEYQPMHSLSDVALGDVLCTTVQCTFSNSSTPG
jgi:hypothetical protein